MLSATMMRSMRLLSRRATILLVPRAAARPSTCSPATFSTLNLPASPTAPAVPRAQRAYSSSTTAAAAAAAPSTEAQPETNSPEAPLLENAPSHLNAAEKDIYDCLHRELKPSALEVQDISGGCGSMYALSVTSEAFKGLSVMKQHRLVNSALGGRVKEWHGVQIRTFVPS